MKAVTYQGMNRVQVKEVADPVIERTDDVIVSVLLSSICGSDLHLYHGLIPSLEHDYVIGHEAIGIIEDVGKDISHIKKGDKFVIPCTIACGHCIYCHHQLESQCNHTNDHGDVGAVFGSSRLFGDYRGSQAELVRVPFAHFTSFVVPAHCEIPDEHLLLVADALPTALWSVQNAGVKHGDTVIVLGSGPIGWLTQKLAWMAGAIRVIAVDCVHCRLEFARTKNQVETYNFEEIDNLGEYLREITQGGADAVIDCVGMDGKMSLLEMAGTLLQIQGGSTKAFQMASQSVRKGGIIQLTGVYGLRQNLFPIGDLFARNVTLKMGYVPANHLMGDCYELLSQRKLDLSGLFSHTFSLDNAEKAYHLFDKNKEECMKVILKP